MENVELLKGEYFKPIKGFETKYQISNFGRIYSNYNKKLHKSIKDKDRYILAVTPNKQKKLHIYDLYEENFTKEEYIWYISTINKSKIENLTKEFKGNLYVEKWKPIKNYENLYEISNFGRVKSCIRDTRTWKIRKESIKVPRGVKEDYMKMVLAKEAETKWFIIHRLVADAFIPNPNNYPIINHLNAIKDDNFYLNLEWCTHSMNVKHANAMGLKDQKEINRRRSKLSFEIAENIRKFAKENTHLAQWEIGKIFGINRENVKDIVNYKSWKD